MRKTSRALNAALSVLIGLTGCSQYNPSPMSQIPIDRCTYRGSFRGAEIGAEPLETPSEVRFFNTPNNFQKDVLKEGIIPLYIIVNSDKPLSLNIPATRYQEPRLGVFRVISAEEAARFHRSEEKAQTENLAFFISPLGAGFGVLQKEIDERNRIRDYILKSFGNDAHNYGVVFFRASNSTNGSILDKGTVTLYTSDEVPQEIKLTNPAQAR